MKSFFLAPLMACVSTLCGAQAFPSKPITLVVGYTPGGSVDLAARTIAPELSKRLNTSVVVENVAGAGGALAAQKVVSAAADGYTLLLGTSAEIGVAKWVSPSVKYNGLTDLSPLGMLATQPIVITTSPASGISDLNGLLSNLRASPGKFSYGSAGNASLPHLAGELFKSRSKTDMVHIPYKGAAPMITDLLGGQVQLGFLLLSSALPHAKAGKLKAIAHTEMGRSPHLPNVPSLSEHPDFIGVDLAVFFGVFAKSSTPRAIQVPIAGALGEVMGMIETQKKFIDAGFNLRALDSIHSARYIEVQAKTYQIVVEQSKIRE